MSWTFDITMSVERCCLVLTRWAKYMLDKIYVGQNIFWTKYKLDKRDAITVVRTLLLQ